MENIRDAFEDLVQEVVDAAQEVDSALEWGWCCNKDRLQEARQALWEFFSERVEIVN